jgi:hypothetical protein
MKQIISENSVMRDQEEHEGEEDQTKIGGWMDGWMDGRRV